MSEFREIVRIAGADIRGHKNLYIGLQKVKGVSFMFSNAITKVLKIDGKTKVGDLSDKQLKKIEDAINDPKKYKIPEFLLNRRNDMKTGEDVHLVSGELLLSRELDVREMKKTKSYKGLRHQANLPVRGQRTKSGYTCPPARRQRRTSIVGVKKRKGKKK